ncbi:MAG: apolipoprotein N-acyltransferase, partial [Actinomycetes bacterium]
MSVVAGGVVEDASPAPRNSRTAPLWMALVGAGVAGALLVVAFPPFGIWLVAPFAIGLLLAIISLGGGSGRRLLRGALLGAVFGTAFFALLTPWLRVIGPDAWILVVAMSAGFTALFGAGAALLMSVRGWVFWIACWWVAIEALRGRVPFGGFPWGRLGHSQAEAPTAAWASIGGVPLLGFLLVAAGGLLVMAVQSAGRRRWARTIAAAGSALAVLVSGLAIPLATDGRDLTVAIVQGNVPRTGMDAFGRREAVLTAHLDAT